MSSRIHAEPQQPPVGSNAQADPAAQRELGGRPTGGDAAAEQRSSTPTDAEPTAGTPTEDVIVPSSPAPRILPTAGRASPPGPRGAAGVLGKLAHAVVTSGRATRGAVVGLPGRAKRDGPRAAADAAPIGKVSTEILRPDDPRLADPTRRAYDQSAAPGHVWTDTRGQVALEVAGGKGVPAVVQVNPEAGWDSAIRYAVLAPVPADSDGEPVETRARRLPATVAQARDAAAGTEIWLAFQSTRSGSVSVPVAGASIGYGPIDTGASIGPVAGAGKSTLTLVGLEKLAAEGQWRMTSYVVDTKGHTAGLWAKAGFGNNAADIHDVLTRLPPGFLPEGAEATQPRSGRRHASPTSAQVGVSGGRSETTLRAAEDVRDLTRAEDAVLWRDHVAPLLAAANGAADPAAVENATEPGETSTATSLRSLTPARLERLVALTFSARQRVDAATAEPSATMKQRSTRRELALSVWRFAADKRRWDETRQLRDAPGMTLTRATTERARSSRRNDLTVTASGFVLGAPDRPLGAQFTVTFARRGGADPRLTQLFERAAAPRSATTDGAPTSSPDKDAPAPAASARAKAGASAPAQPAAVYSQAELDRIFASSKANLLGALGDAARLARGASEPPAFCAAGHFDGAAAAIAAWRQPHHRPAQELFADYRRRFPGHELLYDAQDYEVFELVEKHLARGAGQGREAQVKALTDLFESAGFGELPKIVLTLNALAGAHASVTPVSLEQAVAAAKTTLAATRIGG